MSKEVRAILVVADISGYTKFMKYNVRTISHSKQVIVRLLNAIIKASGFPMKVSDLEGDAVFFHAVCNENNIKKVVEEVKLQMIRIFNSFSEEINILTGLDACSCEACKNTRNLKLKIVVHIGNIQFDKINKIEKLFGLDVIVVHRMLKNSVPSNEYVMMTDEALSDFDNFYGLEGERFLENFEGIGEMNTIVFYPDRIINKIVTENPVKKSHSLMKRLGWESTLAMNTFLDFFRIKKIKGTFKHLNR